MYDLNLDESANLSIAIAWDEVMNSTVSSYSLELRKDIVSVDLYTLISLDII